LAFLLHIAFYVSRSFGQNTNMVTRSLRRSGFRPAFILVFGCIAFTLLLLGRTFTIIQVAAFGFPEEFIPFGAQVGVFPVVCMIDFWFTLSLSRGIFISTNELMACGTVFVFRLRLITCWLSYLVQELR